jgi:hypothetical protein
MPKVSRKTVERELKNLNALDALRILPIPVKVRESEQTVNGYRLSQAFIQHCGTIGGVYPPRT